MAIPFSTNERIANAAESLTLATAMVNDEFMRNQTMLAGNLLIDTINQFLESQTGRRFRDFEFALQDLRGITNDLGPESVGFSEPLTELEQIVDELRDYGLPAETADRINSFAERLQEHVQVSDRQAFLPPGTEPEPLPHPAETLQAEAAEIRTVVSNGEFDAPTLDKLADDPASFELRDYSALADELTAITQ